MGSGSVKSCTVDSQQQIIEETFSGFICTNSNPLTPGNHNLTIIFHDTAIVRFDGLVYTPAAAHFPPDGVDMSYDGAMPGGTPGRLWANTTTNSSVLSHPGDALNVEFTGEHWNISKR